MSPERIATVLPVPDLAEAVDYWQRVLGVEPTFVDGDRWAQFDFGGSRISLAGTDRVSDLPAIMIKVNDLDDDIPSDLESAFGPSEEGLHETRRVGTGPGGWSVVAYTSRP
jgi:hypothetical protein